jgi:uncharacterized protein involved in exopolysaccharide biosynthesis
LKEWTGSTEGQPDLTRAKGVTVKAKDRHFTDCCSAQHWVGLYMPKQLNNPQVLALNGASTVTSIAADQSTRYSPVRTSIEALWRNKWLFAATFLVIVGLAAAVTLLKSKQFKSEMMFLVEASRSRAVISADRASGAAPVEEVTEQQINSEMQLLLSEDVVGSVVDPGWTRDGKAPEEIQQHEEKIAKFLKHLTLESAKKANVINATFHAGTPELAAETLERLSAAYLAKRQMIARPRGTSHFFAEETKRYKDAWERANQDLVAFQRTNGLVSVPDQEEAISQQILSTENDLRAAQTSLAENTQRVKEATRLVAEVPARQDTQQRLVPNQGGVGQLQSMLVQLENRRTELLNRYQPTDRLVVEIDRQIATTSEALKQMDQKRQNDDTTDVNPAWQQLRTGQVQAIVEKRAIESRIGSLQGDLAQLHKQLDQLQPSIIRFNQLQEQVDQARNNYEVFSQKRDQSNIEDAMDEHKLVNVAIAESPTMNYTQTAPKPLLYMALGVLTALFLGGSSVYLAESFRNTIATPRELERVSRYGVLAILPLDRGMTRRGSRVLTAPVISSGDVPGVRTARGLVPAMQNLRDPEEA